MTDKTNVFTALIKRDPTFLDHPLADLLPMRFMGEVAVNAYRGLIKRLDDLPLSLEEKVSRLKDGQDAGKALLMIEARIGELTITEGRAKPEYPAGLRGAGKTKEPLKHERLGMTPSQMRKAQDIARHPAEVAEVIQEAEENEDIPTKTAVLNKIAYKQDLARVKGTREKTKIEMAGDAYLYYSKLQEAIRIIPTTPPKELRENDFLQIKAAWLLIIERGKEFTNETLSQGTGRRLSQRR